MNNSENKTNKIRESKARECAGIFPPSTFSPRAFTLIEMILAIGVAAIVLAAANAVFFTALHLRNDDIGHGGRRLAD
jgi:prepilin-type N-terminal cleavage/methylation domain-containing protein